jgi:broad specificity phosphatase PhoE
MLSRLVLAAAALLLAAAPAAAQQKTTVILVRHAEKALEGGSDPALSEAGQARARALAAELADDSVAAVLVTRFVRTQQTAAPLGIAPRLVAIDGGVEAHAAAVRDAVLAHGGHKVLIVGHSNTVPALVAALGGPADLAIADTEYANLFTVVMEEGKPPVFTRACYGAPDPSGPCAK